MENYKEKFTVNVTDRMVVITDEKGKTLSFHPHEALMLLDILQNEQSELRKMADEASPIPMRIRFQAQAVGSFVHRNSRGYQLHA